MYGDHELPFHLQNGDFSIKTEGSGDGFTYTRDVKEDIVSKHILTDTGVVNISPIEPLNLPMELTNALLIELDTSVIIKPRSKRKLFLSFPVEVGVSLPSNKGQKIVDIFSLVKPKYTLYGDVSTGKICKHHKSQVYPEIPKKNIYHEGIIELSVKNNSLDWVEVHNVVFNAFGMKIYYDDEIVGMKARMLIKTEDISFTDFVDKPLKKGMKKGVELYIKEKQHLKGNRFIMEGGL